MELALFVRILGRVDEIQDLFDLYFSSDITRCKIHAYAQRGLLVFSRYFSNLVLSFPLLDTQRMARVGVWQRRSARRRILSPAMKISSTSISFICWNSRNIYGIQENLLKWMFMRKRGREGLQTK